MILVLFFWYLYATFHFLLPVMLHHFQVQHYKSPFKLVETYICLERMPMFPSFAGFDVYLVGGCVRDLILQRVPKDFDIITSAELKEVILYSFI